MPIPVRRHLRRTAIRSGARPPLKIREVQPRRKSFPAEYRMDPMEAAFRWSQWQGWTLATGVEHGGKGPRPTTTYVKSYGPIGIQGVLRDVYVRREDRHDYAWGLVKGGKILRVGSAPDLWAARTKADNVYSSLPYVAGWNAARKGRKAWKHKSEEWMDGFLAYRAYIARITGGGEPPVQESPEWG